MQSQNWSYLSFYWMELVETFTVCALDVYLLVAKTLRGDVKDFWRYSTFSDWAKIGDFRDFRRLPSVLYAEYCSNNSLSRYQCEGMIWIPSMKSQVLLHLNKQLKSNVDSKI